MRYGPKIVTDSLAWCLDAHDANSYAGEPTTNVLQYPESIGSGPTQESWSGTITANAVTAPDGTKTATKIEATSGHVYERLWIDTTYNSVQFTTGDTITYSIWIKTLDGTTTTSKGPHIWNYNSPTYGIVEQDLSGISPEWKLFKMTHTVAAHQTNFAFVYSSSVSNGLTALTYAIWHPQLEIKSYNTPYVKVSRSVTNGWADLSASGNHGTLTNMTGTGTSHHKEGQLIKPLANSYLNFDGTNDYINSSNYSLSGGQTFEVWFQITGGPDSPAGILVQHDHAVPANFGINHVSSDKLAPSISYTDGTREYSSKTTTTTFSHDVLYHVALVYDTSASKVIWYVNGKYDNQHTLSKTPAFASKPFVIGRWSTSYNDYYFDGNVYKASVYSKTLSATEVKQNFEATRQRFGL